MTKQVQRRRGTATQHTSFTGAEGEISVNTTNKSIHVHDGVTAGGFEAARADLGNVSDASLNTALAGNTLSSLTITSADINGGTIDGAVIGGTTPAAVTGTTLTATTSATLQHSASTKLATTSTGVDVTGTVTADGLVTDTTNGVKINTSSVVEASWTHADVTGTSTINVGRNSTWGGNLIIQTDTKNRAKFASNGDIQFFEDTGTTPKLTWDASAETLYLGNTTGAASNQKLYVDGDIAITTGDSLVFGDGDAAITGYSSGLFYYDANAHAFRGSGGGSDFMRITSTGSVGIGTSSPSSVLHVRNNDAIMILDDANNGTGGTAYRPHQEFWANGTRVGSIGMTDSSNLEIIADNYNSASINFDTGGSERMRITSSGLVGIATSSPNAILTVNGGAVDYTSSATGTGLFHVLGGASSVYTAYIGVADDGVRFGHNGSSRALIFDVNETERMRIDSSGNVGIGTSSPDGNLTVGSTTTSGDISIRIKGDATSRGFLMFGDAGGAQLGDIMYDHSDNHMRFRVNNSERMRIDSSGNVGIGTSSPTSKLHISDTSGNAYIRFDNPGAERNNYIGMEGSDNLVIAADEENLGTDSAIIFRVDANEVARFEDNVGALIVPAGITLGTSAGTYSSFNTLDDYEEGSFTPVVADAASGGNEATTTRSYGYYTKIGRVVTLTIELTNIDTTGLTGANDVYITGLPFTSDSVTGAVRWLGSMQQNYISIGAGTPYMVPTIFESATSIVIGEFGDNNSGDQVIVSQLTSGTADINITIFYQAG